MRVLGELGWRERRLSEGGRRDGEAARSLGKVLLLLCKNQPRTLQGCRVGAQRRCGDESGAVGLHDQGPRCSQAPQEVRLRKDNVWFLLWPSMAIPFTLEPQSGG